MTTNGKETVNRLGIRALAVGIAVAAACVAPAGAETADGVPSKSAAQTSVKWYTDRDAAVKKAKKDGKAILLVAGRDTCSNTTSTRNTCESMSGELSKYVLWYGKVDEDYNTRDYMSGLNSFILPLTCVINPYNPEKYYARETDRQSASGIRTIVSKAAKKVFAKVTFNANGGTPSTKTRSVLIGGAVGTMPKVTRDGYSLVGWFTQKSDGSEVEKTDVVKKKVTYYAHWTANTYRIKFNANGGSGSMETIAATYGKSVTLPANSFKRSNYTFKGWAKKKSGSVDYKNKAKVKNLTAKDGGTVTLYAVWKKKSSKAAAMVGSEGASSVAKAAKSKLAFTSTTKKLATTPKNGNIGVKLSLKIGVSSSSTSLKFSAKNLPKGLSINKKTGKISGVPQKPGSFTSKVTVKDSSGKSISQNVKFKIIVPVWAKGTFYGTAMPDGKNKSYFRFTVGETGKVSGKVMYKSKWKSFKSSMSCSSGGVVGFSPKVDLGSGKTFKPGKIAVQPAEKGGFVYAAAGNAAGDVVAQARSGLVKNGRKFESLLDTEYEFVKDDANSGLTKSSDRLFVKFGNNDTVTVTGKVKGTKIEEFSWALLFFHREPSVSGDSETIYLSLEICVPSLKYYNRIIFRVYVDSEGDVGYPNASFQPF